MGLSNAERQRRYIARLKVAGGGGKDTGPLVTALEAERAALKAEIARLTAASTSGDRYDLEMENIALCQHVEVLERENARLNAEHKAKKAAAAPAAGSPEQAQAEIGKLRQQLKARDTRIRMLRAQLIEMPERPTKPHN